MRDVVTVSVDALRDFWHPVAFSEEVGTAPSGVVLLEEQLCLWRDEGGVPVAMRDLCVHRGTPLTLGWVHGDEITCAYHGWTYRRDGMCTRIPSVPADRHIPPRARVNSYRVAERYGIVWVCLGDPRADLAAFPEFSDDAFHTFVRDHEDWDANAARLIENFVDTAHFAWVHDGLLGRRDDPEVPPIAVRRKGHTIEVELEMAVKTDVHLGSSSVIWDQVTLPFSVRQVRTDPSGGRHIVFLAISPVTRKTLRRFLYKMRDFDLDAPDDRFIEKSRLVASQDRGIVERQRPEELPVDLTAELHVKGPDDAALVYRKALAGLGVEVG
ncbi:MAG: Rieske 2Fe-2S domain-containing protein [Acidimicrobiales bacterium]